MKSSRALSITFFVFAIVCAAKYASAEKAWLQVRSEHFAVITDVGEKRGLEIAQRCEQMGAAFSVLMNRATTPDPAPLVIFAVSGQKQVDDLLNGGHGKSRHAGVFLSGSDENFILLDASEDPWPIAFHEYAHELLNANAVSNVQTWFEEGFAEYFSTFESSSTRFELGRVPLRELRFLRRNGKLMRLADLISVNQNSQIYNQNGPAQELFYAESWLLVHYLFDHQLVGRAEPFFALMAGGRPLNEALQTSFGMSMQKLESELLNYARGESFRYFSLPMPRKLSNALAANRLSEVTIAALKAEVRWHGKLDHSEDEAEQSASEYKSLLAREPGNANALRGLGLAMLELHHYDSSLQYLLQAVSAAPNEAVNQHALSLLWAAAPELQAEYSAKK